MSDLRFFVEAWRHSADAIAGLTVSDDQWNVDTDLPGWRARDILAHLVHLERVLVEGEPEPEQPSDVPVPAEYTEAGVDALSDVPIAALRADFAALIEARSADLVELPEDGTTPPPRTPAHAPWNTETLLRNRAFDLWMHEQDLRRAFNQPGNLDSPGAHLSVGILATALPFIVAKKAQVPAGTSARIIVADPVQVDATIVVSDDGRGRVVDSVDDDPDVTVSMDTEALVVLGGGRRTADRVNATVRGDADLGQRILESMTVTF